MVHSASSLKKLLSHIAIDQEDFRGQTALHIAVLESNPVKVRELLEAASNPETLDINGISPLELAKQTSDGTISKMLSEGCSSAENVPCDQNISEPQKVHFSNEHKMEHRVTCALHKLFYQANQKSSSKQFMDNYKSKFLYLIEESSSVSSKHSVQKYWRL